VSLTRTAPGTIDEIARAVRDHRDGVTADQVAKQVGVSRVIPRAPVDIGTVLASLVEWRLVRSADAFQYVVEQTFPGCGVDAGRVGDYTVHVEDERRAAAGTAARFSVFRRRRHTDQFIHDTRG
jgi:hypothetical protein